MGIWMLTINEHQWQILEDQHQRNLSYQLAEHARKFHYQRVQDMGAENLERFIHRSIETATIYDLKGLQSIAKFFSISMVCGLPLPQNIIHILSNTTIESPVKRLETVWKLTLFDMEAL